MGNCNECTEANSFEYDIDESNTVDAEKLELLGVGSFARVWKIKLRSYDCDDSEPIIPEYFEQALALKEFTKHTLIDLLNKTEDYNQSKEYAISHDVAELAN